MNPNEAWIGKTLAVGLISLAIWVIIAILTGTSEAARRTRVVGAVAIALGLSVIVIAAAGPIGFAAVVVVVGASTWIIRGMK